MTENPMNALWVEKYRPQTLNAVALHPEHRELLKSYIQKGEIPHLILSGPAGCGKTTVAKILIRNLDCEVMSLNASKDRGIDVIRDRIGTFAKVMPLATWKVVFFDEADGMTSDAQNSLRNMMEDYAEQTRFIFTANHLSKIISPLQSRCTSLEFGETPLKERVLVLKQILEQEQVQFQLPHVLQYAEKYTDLRRMIVAAQRASSGGYLNPPNAEGAVLGRDILDHVVKEDWDSLVNVSRHPNFDHRQGLKDMFWAVGDVKELKKPVNARLVLAKAVHESGFTPDPVVHFLGTCAELITL